MWNEDLMFVAAKPFEEPVVPNKEELLGKCVIPLQMIEKHVVIMEGDKKKEIKFASNEGHIDVE
ncbi:C2 domain protein [Medicago truncatula]|uniref:C2 domain protein n=1 Tax=Medicago truncatula TaxID=3880 RepID=G7KY25_MEDTR|nr:C2 domain protein [Medicago truncatula]